MVLWLAAPAFAAVTRIAGPAGLVSDSRIIVKLDVAYDSVNHVYLAVYGTQRSGPVNGLLLNEGGVPISGLFALSDGAQQSGWARVIFAPEEGKFLVSFVRILGPGSHQKVARFVTYAGNGAVSRGPEIVLESWAGNSGTASGMAYSSASRKFLVTWSHYAGAAPYSFVSTIDSAGTATAPTVVSDPADGESDPEIACDPANHTCLVIGVAWGMTNGARPFFWGRFIDDRTGVPIGGPRFLTNAPGLVDPPGVVFSPATGQFLVGVGTGNGVITGVTGRADTGAMSLPFTIMQGTGASDGVGYGFLQMRYNSGTQTTLLTATTWIGLAAVQELDGAGARTAGGFALIPDTPNNPNDPWNTTNQFAVPAANPAAGQFGVIENHAFATLRSSIFSAAVARSAPVVTINPADRTVKSGKQATFTAAATGTPTPTVLWQESRDGTNWTNVPGATSTVFEFNALPGDTGKLFRARFTNTVSPDAVSATAKLTVKGGAATDLDGDGKADPLIWSASSGTWRGVPSSGTTNSLSAGGVQWGNQSLGDIALPGDVDGDGMGDLVLWRASTGTWYWLTSSSNYSYAASGSKQWGNQSLGDIPLLADIDGDGKSDLIVWRASTGTWFWLTSSSGYNYNALGVKQWGNSALGDKPFVGDFDGDGAGDLAVWRASSGTWYWLTSSTGYSYAAGGARQWGNASLGDVPLLGDLDGDGRADLVVWRSTSGTWYWLTSGSGYTGAAARQYGNAGFGDVPLLADLDGDGRSDIVIWRGANGFWYSLTAASDFLAQITPWPFGSAGDTPIIK